MSEIREYLANDNDPAEGRKKVRQNKRRAKLNQERKSDGLPILNSFADITGKWLDSIINTNTSDTLTKKKNRLTTWIFPFIGDKPIDGIKSAEVLAALKP